MKKAEIKLKKLSAFVENLVDKQISFFALNTKIANEHIKKQTALKYFKRTSYNAKISKAHDYCNFAHVKRHTALQ